VITRGGLDFTPDGRRLVTGHDDGTALVWDLTGTGRPSAAGATRLSPEGLAGLWESLGDAKSDTVTWELTDRPGQAVALFREKLKPVAAADRAVVEGLVKRLDSPVFADREAAGRELTELGDAAVPQLRKILADGGSAEQRGRIERILTASDATLLPAGDRLRQVRAITVLERIGTADARRLLGEWADGLPSARLTRTAKAALARMR
jgi:hypothetical protein